MARRINAIATYTPAVVADTVAMVTTTLGHVFKGGSATQYTRFWEISISGQASSSSSPTFMLFSRDSTVGVGSQTASAGQTDSALDPGTAALAAICGVGNQWGTTYPQRDSANHLMNCSLNAFGGVFFWRANRAEECPAMVGNTASNGESSLTAFTGGTVGLIGSHVIYETS